MGGKVTAAFRPRSGSCGLCFDITAKRAALEPLNLQSRLDPEVGPRLPYRTHVRFQVAHVSGKISEMGSVSDRRIRGVMRTGRFWRSSQRSRPASKQRRLARSAPCKAISATGETLPIATGQFQRLNASLREHYSRVRASLMIYISCLTKRTGSCAVVTTEQPWRQKCQSNARRS